MIYADVGTRIAANDGTIEKVISQLNKILSVAHNAFPIVMALLALWLVIAFVIGFFLRLKWSVLTIATLILTPIITILVVTKINDEIVTKLQEVIANDKDFSWLLEEENRDVLNKLVSNVLPILSLVVALISFISLNILIFIIALAIHIIIKKHKPNRKRRIVLRLVYASATTVATSPAASAVVSLYSTLDEKDKPLIKLTNFTSLIITGNKDIANINGLAIDFRDALEAIQNAKNVTQLLIDGKKLDNKNAEEVDNIVKVLNNAVKKQGVKELIVKTIENSDLVKEGTETLKGISEKIETYATEEEAKVREQNPTATKEEVKKLVTENVKNQIKDKFKDLERIREEFKDDPTVTNIIETFVKPVKSANKDVDEVLNSVFSTVVKNSLTDATKEKLDSKETVSLVFDLIKKLPNVERTFGNDTNANSEVENSPSNSNNQTNPTNPTNDSTSESTNSDRSVSNESAEDNNSGQPTNGGNSSDNNDMKVVSTDEGAAPKNNDNSANVQGDQPKAEDSTNSGEATSQPTETDEKAAEPENKETETRPDESTEISGTESEKEAVDTEADSKPASTNSASGNNA
ncbi:hypothetical protein ACJA23_03480 [Mycoplasma corogypsi]|uniref:hypothetical protein n=1 Tax=Mycoplasma corogypsi TaxID=2106 RepID=UPI0038738D0B